MTADKGESKGPLQGVRIIDLSMMLAGPSGSMLMGDLGAEIIKVEPLDGDETRVGPPYFYAENMSAYYWSINRNKKSVVINLKSPEGRQVLYDLVTKSDVVYDNYRPGVLERLQSDYETLKKYNPQIICCSISTYGYTGPYRDRPGYDLIVQAVSGGMSITGEPGGSPVRAGIPLGDLVGGLLGVHGVLAAYIHRQKTGEGQRLEVSLLDGQIYLLTYVAQYYFNSGKIPGPIGSGHQSLVPYQAFKTKDIQIVIVAHQDHHFQRLCKAIGKPEWAEDPRFNTRTKRLENKSQLIPMMEAHLMTRPGDEWLEAIHKAGVPAGPINTLDRVLSDPQVLSRDMVKETDGPGKEKIKILGNPLKFDKTPVDTFTRPPQLGEHTREVLTNILGYSAEKIDSLVQKEAIKTA
ncbi:MAG: CoA transferase [Thermodesulfobacteriota bacterium]|nr:CoA transferase [Thermodesulfobacteriota bacterium]